MRIEIIKTPKGFQIPQLESVAVPDRFFATVDLPSLDPASQTSLSSETTRRLVEKTLKDIGEDDFLEGLLRRLANDYRYVAGNRSESDVLFDALREKYAL